MSSNGEPTLTDIIAKLDAINKRLDNIDGRLNRLDSIDARLIILNDRIFDLSSAIGGNVSIGNYLFGIGVVFLSMVAAFIVYRYSS